jgi:multicomponent K+:H+ antiporter subunit G
MDPTEAVTLPFWLDALLGALLLIGTAFALIGSWGLAKLSDFLKRLHGPTKATTLGVGCVLIASALWFSAARGTASLHELLITLFLFLTAPVSAQLLIKAAWRADRSLQRPPPPPGGAGKDSADA